MKNFFSQFGTVDSFDLKNKTSIVLFKSFFSANVCREFLSNENNFKDNMKNNFAVRWFKLENDEYLLSDELKQKYTLISQQYSNSSSNNISHKKLTINQTPQQQQMQQMMQNQFIPNMQMNMNVIPNLSKMPSNNMSMNYYSNPNYMMHMHMQGKNAQNGSNPNAMGQNINNYYNGTNNQQGNGNMMNQSQNNYNNVMNNNNNNNNNQSNNNIYEEKSTYGKFTCKFEILIPNDQEFQVVRRLIGSKGCNMKKIVDSCKGPNDIGQGNVKLRLRGKGSGYKEGPQNKESDDPLHLCISAKNQDSLKKACGLVSELIGKIYEDYKKHCHKTGVPPLPKIANKIDGGNTVHIKNNNNNNNNNNQGINMNMGMNVNMGMGGLNMNMGNHY